MKQGLDKTLYIYLTNEVNHSPLLLPKPPTT